MNTLKMSFFTFTLTLLIFMAPSWAAAGSAELSGDFKNAYDSEAKKCTDIPCIRKNIDRINDQMIELLGLRTAYVRRAGILKGPNKPANDPKRVEEELEMIGKKSEEHGVPSEIGIDVFKLLIDRSIRYQQKYKDDLKKKANYEF